MSEMLCDHGEQEQLWSLFTFIVEHLRQSAS